MTRKICGLLIACACSPTDSKTGPYPAEVDSGSDDTGTFEEVPWILDETEGEGLSFSPEPLASAIQAVIPTVPLLSGAPVGPAYLEAMSWTTDSCPTWYEDEGTEYWYDNCSTEAGATFEGYAAHVPAPAWVEGDRTWSGSAFWGLATIETPDGTFRSSGSSGHYIGHDTDGTIAVSSYAEPGFSYSGPAGSSSWISSGMAPGINIYGERTADGNDGFIAVSASFDQTDGALAIIFEDLLFISEGWGSTCPSEPSGTISILDEEGHWFDILFDGPTWERPLEDPERCDGCGNAWYRGELVGEICVDFTPIATLSAWPFAE